jgi:aryl-alcohol dehydrogenase-like predicted oxidoreductase
MPALVIAWTVAQPGVSHALCGSRKPEHITDTAKAGDVELSDDDLATMNEAIEQHVGELV